MGADVRITNQVIDIMLHDKEFAAQFGFLSNPPMVMPARKMPVTHGCSGCGTVNVSSYSPRPDYDSIRRSIVQVAVRSGRLIKQKLGADHVRIRLHEGRKITDFSF